MTSLPSSSASNSSSSLSCDSRKRGKQLHSVAVGTENEVHGETHPRRSAVVGNGPLATRYDPNIQTVHDNFMSACQQFPSNLYLGTRRPASASPDGKVGPYQWLTYSQTLERVKNIASGMSSIQILPKNFVGIYSNNRREWMILDHACCYGNIISVPLYDTLGELSLEHICNQTELKVIFCSKEKVPNILRLKPKLPLLQTLVVFDPINDAKLEKECQACSLEVVTFIQLEKLGVENLVNYKYTPPISTDIMTICYTSGTTGLPKGVVIRHEMMVAEIAGIHALSKAGKFINFYSKVVHLSFLPLAHVFERSVQHIFLVRGGSVGFYQGDVLKVIDDIAELKPTVLIVVPRVLNKIYDKVMAQIMEASFMKKLVFNTAYNWKKDSLRAGNVKSFLFDRVVFAKIKKFLGGNVHSIVTGAAPISPEVMDFVRICFSCDVYEGYGQTETCASSTVSLRRDCQAGHVGPPIPSVEVKLVDVPDMQYFCTDKPFPRGEICFRGGSCFIEYYKEPEKTAETVDADGWVHTGDIGLFDQMGRVKIIDRKKNIFKLSQGEYIAPEKIENILVKHPLVSQVYVYGESIKTCLVAVVVPDQEQLTKANSKISSECSYEEFCKSNECKELIMKAVASFGSKGSQELKGFEIPRNIHIETEPFSIANGFMTDTMKLKRHEAKKYYASVLSSLYAQINE